MEVSCTAVIGWYNIRGISEYINIITYYVLIFINR